MAGYITCELNERLGNNLFQISHAYAQAIKHNRSFVIFDQGHEHLLNFYPNIFRKFDFLRGNIPNHYVSVETPFSFKEITPDLQDCVFKGWYQSEKFFKPYSNIIKDLYTPQPLFVDNMLMKYPMLKDSNVTAIHVRRGDYIKYPLYHPVFSSEYIRFAASQIPTDWYFIFSDDIQWCKDNIFLKSQLIIEESDWASLWIMSMCKNFIISNSTFSWWGSYLSKNENKTIIAPRIWFGPGYNYHNVNDVYCDSCTIMPSEYCDGTIIPIYK